MSMRGERATLSARSNDTLIKTAIKSHEILIFPVQLYEQDWQPYRVDPYFAIWDVITIHTDVHQNAF